MVEIKALIGQVATGAALSREAAFEAFESMMSGEVTPSQIGGLLMALRVRGGYGKSLLRRRGELVERSFAHCYETGGMRRTHLRGHENILKRQLVHVGAFNLSLILRQLLGAGTPRQWKDLEGTPFLLFIYYLLVGKIEIGSQEAESQYLVRNRSWNHEVDS